MTKPILVVYATREGQTRKIAKHVGERLEARQQAFVVLDAAEVPEEFDLSGYSAVLVCASLHAGKYEKEVVRFAKKYLVEVRDALASLPTVFLSVSLSERTVEDEEGDPALRAQAAADVKRTIDEFLAETGWHPTHVAAAAGALLYRKYNFVIRLIMKRISRKAGGPVDTSRDYEFTDWNRIDQLVDDLLAMAG
jgi:menaquinone-dependent protoporphyrinogen oxidase